MYKRNNEDHFSKNVIIIGAGGHGRVIADIIALSGDVVLGFLEDKNPSEFSGVTILGKLKDVEKYKQDSLFIVGIGNNQLRKQIMIFLMLIGIQRFIQQQ